MRRDRRAAARGTGSPRWRYVLLHAYANPAHERRAGAILTEALPGVPVCLSTDILAEFREYERASTVALNAYVLPVIDELPREPDRAARRSRRGARVSRPDVPVMVMEAAGGLMTVASARAKPVHTVLSGPAGGVVASAHVAALSGFADIIAMDMGGTSTDISLVLDGRPQVTREAALDGIPIRIPVIDINAIGAGGGSIAWIDEGGALRVGPKSAEAVPGPGLLRPRRRGADRHRRQSRARPARRRHAARRRAGARRRGRAAGHRDAHRRTARPRPDRSRLRHSARRERDDGARHPRRLGRARPRPAPPDAGAVRRRRADARLAAGARAGDPAPA